MDQFNKDKDLGSDIDPSTGNFRSRIAEGEDSTNSGSITEDEAAKISSDAPEISREKITNLLSSPEGRERYAQAISFFERKVALLRRIAEENLRFEQAKQSIVTNRNNVSSYQELIEKGTRNPDSGINVTYMQGQLAMEEAKTKTLQQEVPALEQALVQLRASLVDQGSKEREWRTQVSPDQALAIDQAVIVHKYAEQKGDISIVKQHAPFFQNLAAVRSELKNQSAQESPEIFYSSQFDDEVRYISATQNLGLVVAFAEGKLSVTPGKEPEVTQRITEALRSLNVLTPKELEKLKNFDEFKFMIGEFPGLGAVPRKYATWQGDIKMANLTVAADKSKASEAQRLLDRFGKLKDLVDKLLRSVGLECVPIVVGETEFDSNQHIGIGRTYFGHVPEGVITAIIRPGLRRGEELLKLPEVFVNRRPVGEPEI